MNSIALLCFFGCISLSMQCGSSVTPRANHIAPPSLPATLKPSGAQITDTSSPKIPQVDRILPGSQPCECNSNSVAIIQSSIMATIGDMTEANAGCELPITCQSNTPGMQTSVTFNDEESMSDANANSRENQILLECNDETMLWETEDGIVVNNVGCSEECSCDNDIELTDGAMLGEITMCSRTVTCPAVTNMKVAVSLTVDEQPEQPELAIETPIDVKLECDAVEKLWKSPGGGIVESIGCKQLPV